MAEKDLEKENLEGEAVQNEAVEEQNENVVTMKNALKGIEYLYNHPEKRAEDFMEAILDKDIKGIICNIGGDDTIRLLQYIDFEAIVNNPKLLICDEPTGNLDPEKSMEIMDILNNINKTLGTTIIMATHDKTIVNTMKKRVLVIKNGKLAKDSEKGVYNDADL